MQLAIIVLQSIIILVMLFFIAWIINRQGHERIRQERERKDLYDRIQAGSLIQYSAHKERESIRADPVPSYEVEEEEEHRRRPRRLRRCSASRSAACELARQAHGEAR
jgi:hypothetical protein